MLLKSILSINLLISDELNSKITNDLDRLTNDLQDLQSFVYNNLNPDNQNNNTSNTKKPQITHVDTKLVVSTTLAR